MKALFKSAFQLLLITTCNLLILWTSVECNSEDILKSNLGVSPQVDVYTIQPDVLLTYRTTPTVKLGETVPLIIATIKDKEGCIPIVITLEESRDYKIVGHLNEVRKCLCGDKPFLHTYRIYPLTNGNINMTVSVKPDDSTNNSKTGSETIPHFYDELTIPIQVKDTVLPIKEESHSKWTCTKKDLKNVQYPIQIPSDCTPDLSRATLAVSGDLVAPTFNDLHKLLKWQRNSGEETMMQFAPNFFVLQYLKSTKLLNVTVNKTAIDYINAGYRYELKYQMNDGSFSLWRRMQGSIWLTAFVIKSFAQAKSMIDIDPNVVQRGIVFIASHQYNTSGCFKRYGRVYHRSMQGIIGSGDESTFALTSYITIALLEAGYDPSRQVISRAFECIEQDTGPDIYRLAMKAYALALAGNTNSSKTLLKTLETRATTQGDMTYWSNGPNSSRENNIETTSYVLLAISSMHIDDPTFGMRVVRWLVDQANSNGGFKFTQNTVLGIQAVERFVSRLSIGATNAVVIFRDGGKNQVINVDDSNRLKVQERAIELVSDIVDIEIGGEGCVLTQVTIICSGKPTRFPELDLNVTVSPIEDDRNEDKIDDCSSLKVKDILKESEIHDKVNSGQLTINLYIDELTEDGLCFDVVISDSLK